jgi:hypothetical protein
MDNQNASDLVSAMVAEQTVNLADIVSHWQADVRDVSEAPHKPPFLQAEMGGDRKVLAAAPVAGAP